MNNAFQRPMLPIHYAPQPAQPQTQQLGAVGGGSSASSILPWVIGIGGIAAVAFILLKNNKSEGEKLKELRRRLDDKDELYSWANYFLDKKGLKNDFEDWVESGEAAREFAEFED